jgi:Phage tail sheath protein subtilisin-like domain/Phage tail sheath C-terminal domain
MSNLTQQSADVRFNEIDLSRVIASNSSANAAIVLVSKKGRLSRFNVTTATDFNAEYGLPDASVSFGHYTASDFFKEGTSLQVVRVAGSGHSYAAAIMTCVYGVGVNPVYLNTISAGIPDPANMDWSPYVSGSGEPIVMFYPKSGPGSYANTLAIKILSENLSAPSPVGLSHVTTGGSVVPGPYAYSVSAISAIGETLASTVSTYTVPSGTSTNVINVTWTPVAGARGYDVYGRVNGSLALLATVGSTVSTFADRGIITPSLTQFPITNPANLPAPDPTFTVQIFDTAVNSSVPLETFVCTLQDRTDGNGTQTEITQLINPYSSYVSVDSYVPLITSGIIPPITPLALTVLSGGNSGAAPTNGQISLAWTDNFSDTEQVKVNTLINAGYTDVTVQQTMLQVASGRGDAFAILDMPSTMQAYQDAIAYRQLTLNANSNYGAIYTSDVLENDIHSGKKLYIPPSGWVAAIFARTDRVAGPQFAPAGLNRGLIDVLALRTKYNGPQRTQLFNAQVNYIRNFIGEGNAVFEQVTLQASHSALSWVNVRRLVNVIKSSVRDFLIYSIHEPNDDFTRKAIVRSVSDYLQYWKNARGILDFSVISDDTNNPPAQYNLGILKVTVFITPVIAVHEIQVDMVISKAGLAFSEINLSNLG